MAVKKNVSVIPPQIKYDNHIKLEQKKLRVAAYCRVSTLLEQQEGSYEAQVDYYTNKINTNPNWICAGIFADEGKSATGTKKRDDFNAMISACQNDKIDLILTKSVSRLSRNTLDTIKTIRMLKERNIGIIFENQGVNTLTSNGELLISILASQAQEESRNISENTRWGIMRSFENGKVKVNHKQFLGYTKDAEGNLVIVPEEATIIKRIFREYLEGNSSVQIAKSLESDGIKTKLGKEKWHPRTIDNMLSQEKYCGDALLQKTYTIDFLTKKKVKNNGYVKQFYVEDDHEAIIPKDIYNQVQEEKAKRANLHKSSVTRKKNKQQKSKYSSKYVLTELLVCDTCGHPYRRQKWVKNQKETIVWRCEDRLKQGTKSKCQKSQTIKEVPLQSAIMRAINNVVKNKDDFVAVFRDNVLSVIGDYHKGNDSLKIYDEKIAELQKTMIKMIEDNVQNGEVTEIMDDAYKAISNEINKLKEEKAKIIMAEKQANEITEQLNELDSTLISNQNLNEFDSDLVKRLIKTIKVRKNKTIEIQFHSGIVTEENVA